MIQTAYTRYDLLYMIFLYIKNHTVYTGAFRVICDQFKVAYNPFEIKHFLLYVILVYSDSRNSSIM